MDAALFDKVEEIDEGTENKLRTRASFGGRDTKTNVNGGEARGFNRR